MTLQRYVLKQLLIAIAFAVGGILFVLMPAILVNAVHKVGSAGLFALAFYLPLVLADLVPYIFPLGFLLAVVTTFGRMAADREWTAVRMAGIQPAKLLLPGLGIAILLGLGTDWLASSLAPSWKYKQRDYKRTVMQNAVKRFSPGRTEVRIPGFFLTAARRDPKQPIFYEAHISISRPGDDGQSDRSFWMFAERVGFELDGNVLIVRLSQARLIKGEQKLANEAPTFRIDLDEILRASGEDPTRAKFMTSGAMRDSIDGGALEDSKREEYVYEIHRRHALGATYLLFLLLGFPTGVRLRSSTQLAAFSVAVAYAIAYYVLSLRLAQQLHTSGTLPPALAPWITNIVGVAIGAFFSWKVVRE